MTTPPAVTTLTSLFLGVSLGCAAGAQESDDPSPAVEHVVRSGESLSVLANRYEEILGGDLSMGARLAMIRAANGMGPTASLIHVGDTLRIPREGSALGISDVIQPESPGMRLARAGNRALVRNTEGHWDSIDRTGVGLFYGDRSSYHRLSTAEKRDWIARHQEPGTNAPWPSRSSCIGWALHNVGQAFQGVGRGGEWSAIRARVVADGARGTVLAKELQRIGWTAVYFNPDERKASDGNAEHTYTARIVRNGQPYYGIRVSDRVVNYRPTSGSSTQQDLRGIEKLEQVPFWFGLAKGGVHTFMGRNATVNEFHWTSSPDSKHAIEERPLREFPWLSGVIMVPPGVWPQ